jgi:hypothetical protein
MRRNPEKLEKSKHGRESPRQRGGEKDVATMSMLSRSFSIKDYEERDDGRSPEASASSRRALMREWPIYIIRSYSPCR